MCIYTFISLPIQITFVLLLRINILTELSETFLKVNISEPSKVSSLNRKATIYPLGYLYTPQNEGFVRKIFSICIKKMKINSSGNYLASF